MAADPTGRPLPSLQSRVAVICCLLLVAVLYVAISFRPTAMPYLDYVDGYYLYVSHRLAHGVVLYTGVMGVQPPGIFLVGEATFRLRDTLVSARVYGLLLHLGTMFTVYLLAMRLYRSARIAVLAALLYILAPYGLVWSRIFDPNPLVTFLSLVSVLLVASSGRVSAMAGVVGAAALLTKVWYLPVCIATIYLLFRYRRQQLRPFVWAMLLAYAAGTCFGMLAAGTNYWQGLLAQDSSGFSASWFEASIVHVLDDDWPLLVLGILGMLNATRLPMASMRGYPAVATAACAVLAATIKTGTAWPVFEFAEPFLAVVAAGTIARIAVPHMAPDSTRDSARRRGVTLQSIAGVALCVLAACYASWHELQQFSGWSDRSVQEIASFVRSHSRPEQTLLGPPYYLYVSDRRAYGEYADINIWANRVASGDAAAIALLGQLNIALGQSAIPVVLEDSRVARLPGVAVALRTHYMIVPLIDPLPPDRVVTVWVPRQ